MSASETNVKKQTKRHRGPLIGMIAVLVFALGLFTWWLMHEATEGTSPQGAPVQIDGRTGDAEVQPPSTLPDTSPDQPAAMDAPAQPAD